MKSDDFGDWRLKPLGRLAHDVPEAFPGGPSHKAGAPIYMTTLAETTQRRFGFLTPSTTAMCLHSAITAAQSATSIAKNISWKPYPGPSGTVQSIEKKDAPALYDYFQECMVSAVFSYISLEAFANEMIALKKEHVQTKVGKRSKLLSPEEAERMLSTEEKIKTVLPRLLNVRSPAGIAIWEKFRLLRDARDSIVHFKMEDQKPKNSATAESTLYFQFLGNDPMKFPKAAVSLFDYFHPINKPRWLTLVNI